MRSIAGLVFTVAILVGISRESHGDSIQRDFFQSFEPAIAGLENFTRANVETAVDGSNFPLVEFTAIDYFDSFVNGFECKIVASVDNVMDRLSVMHFEGNPDEEHSLWSGGCRTCTGSGFFVAPVDVDHYSIFWGNPAFFQHTFYVVDYSEHQVVPVEYKTHLYALNGARQSDIINYGVPFGRNELLGPTGVAVLPGASPKVLICDTDASAICVYSLSGSLLARNGPDVLGFSDYRPRKIAVVESENGVFLATLGALDGPAGSGSNVRIFAMNGNNLSQIHGAYIDDAIDIEASRELGFVVLAATGKLHQIGFDGSAIQDLSMQNLDQGVSALSSIAVSGNEIVLGYDYDNDSGFGVFRKKTSLFPPEIAANVVYRAFENCEFDTRIDRRAQYTCEVRSSSGQIVYAGWGGEYVSPGLWHHSVNCSGWADGEYNVQLRDQASAVTAVAPVKLRLGPEITFSAPQPLQQFYDDSAVFLTYDVQFSGAAQIDSNVAYFGPSSNIQRMKKQPGEANTRGSVSFRFDVPDVQSTGFWQHWFLDLRSYFRVNGATVSTVTSIDPYLLVDHRESGGGGVSCMYPCRPMEAGGKVLFINGRRVFVEMGIGRESLIAYVADPTVKRLSIYDLAGRRVCEVDVNQTINGFPGATISLSDYRMASGVYFARIGTSAEDTARFAVIK